MIRTVAMKAPVELTTDIITGRRAYASSGLCFGWVHNALTEHKTWRDESDILRTSKKVDEFGNKACYHDYVTADLITKTSFDHLTTCPLPSERIAWEDIPGWLVEPEGNSFVCSISHPESVSQYAVRYEQPTCRASYNYRFDKNNYYARVVSPGNAVFDMAGNLLEITQPFTYNGTLYLLVMDAWSTWGYSSQWGRWWGYGLHVQTMVRNVSGWSSYNRPMEIGNIRSDGLFYASELSNSSRNTSLQMTRTRNALTNAFADVHPALDSFWNRYLTETEGGTSNNHPSGEQYCQMFQAFDEIRRDILYHAGRWWNTITTLIDACTLTQPRYDCHYRLDTDDDNQWSYRGYIAPYRLFVGCADSLPALPRQTLRRFNKLIAVNRQHVVLPAPPTPWSSLSSECIDQLKQLDVNVISFITELKDVTKSTRGLFDFLSKPKGSRRNLCSLWLSQRYGDRLTLSDMEEIFRSVTDHISSTVAEDVSVYRSRRTNQSISALGHPFIERQFEDQFYQVYITPSDFNHLMGLIRRLMDWGAWLDLANAWDMIPLSFVVDWFLNVGDTLDSIDRMVHEMYYTVLSVIRTRKVQTELSPQLVKYPDWGVAGWNKYQLVSLSHLYYFREVRATIDELPLQPITLSLPDLVNVVDGAALLLQR